MGFRDFRIQVVARVLLLFGLIAVLAWGLVNTDWQVTPIVCTVLAILCVIEFIHYVESVNRELASFLEFVAHDDFSASFPIAEKGRVFRRLESGYKVLAERFRTLNIQKEANHQFLEAIVDHLSTALVCLNDAGFIVLANRQAKALFGISYLTKARSLARVDANLPGLLRDMKEGSRTLIHVEIGGGTLQLALFATEFELLGQDYKLISFQDIRDELEQREIDFSHKLIRVLTHEIMNSVTPIISLSKVVEDELLDARNNESSSSIDVRRDDDLLRSVSSIHSRSSGLKRFVQAYSRLTNLPQPNRKHVDVAGLLEEVGALIRPTLGTDIVLENIACEPGMTLYADPEQLQQVLINLVNNAIEALADREGGRIQITAERDDRGGVVIRVTDNGLGIESEHLDNIFVPFFTTKPQGTGVGLSVSRQLLLLNGGSISANSAEGRCEFILKFRQPPAMK